MQEKGEYNFMANDFNIPIWENTGEEPPLTLLKNGYQEYDTPASAHFNYLMNRLTVGMSEVYNNSVSKEGGVLDIGIPTPYSESRNRWVSGDNNTTTVVEQDHGGYLVTAKKASPISISMDSPTWNSGFPVYSEEDTVFSLVFYVRSPNNYGESVTVTTTSMGTTILGTYYGDTFTESVSNTAIYEKLVRVEFKHKVGTDLRINLAISRSEGNVVGSTLIIGKPTTIYGTFYTGNSISSPKYSELSKESFKYFSEEVDGTLPLPTNKFGSMPIRFDNPKNGVMKGRGVLSTFSVGTTPSDLLARVLFIRDEAGYAKVFIGLDSLGEEPKFKEVVTEDDLINFHLSKYYTSNEINDRLNMYANKQYLNNFVTITDSSKWQKSKITGDDGSVLHDMDLPTSIDGRVSIIENVHSLATIKGGLDNFLLTSVDLKSTLTYNGVNLSLLDGSFTAYLEGTIQKVENSSLVIAELVGRLYLPNNPQKFNMDIIRIQVTYNLGVSPIKVTLTQQYDQGSIVEQINTLVYSYGAEAVGISKMSSQGELLYSGTASTVGTNITTSHNLSKYSYLRVVFLRGDFPIEDLIPIKEIRKLNLSTFTLQANYMDEQLVNVWGYEMAVASSDGFTGKRLTIQTNNRFNIISKSSATGTTNLRIVSIHGLVL